MSVVGEQKPPTSQLAWTALICALMVCIPPLGMVAILLGSIALGRIRNSNGALGGRRMALLAMGLGAASSVGWLISIEQFNSWYQEKISTRMNLVIKTALDGAQSDDFDRVRSQFSIDGDQLLQNEAISGFGVELKDRWGRLLDVSILPSTPQRNQDMQRWAVAFELEFEHAKPIGAATFVLVPNVGGTELRDFPNGIIPQPLLVELEITEAEKTLRLGPG